MAKRVIAKKKPAKKTTKKTSLKRTKATKRAASKGAKKNKLIAAPKKKPVDPLFKKGGLNDLFLGKLPHKKNEQPPHAHSFSHEARPLRQPPESRVPKAGLATQEGQLDQ